MGKNSFSVNVCYWPFLRLRTRLGQLCVRLWSHSAVQHNSEQPTSKHCKPLVLVISFSSLITKQHCLSLIWISFSHVTVLYLCRFSSTSFKWTAFLVHVVRISLKKIFKSQIVRFSVRKLKGQYRSSEALLKFKDLARIASEEDRKYVWCWFNAPFHCFRTSRSCYVQFYFSSWKRLWICRNKPHSIIILKKFIRHLSINSILFF